MPKKSKKLPRLENTWIADFYEILGTSGAGKRAAAGQLFRAARGGVKTFRAPPGHVVVPVTAEVPQYQPASAKTIREKYEASPEGQAKAAKTEAKRGRPAKAPATVAAPATPKRRGRPPKAARATPSTAEMSLEQMPAEMMAPAAIMSDSDDLSRRMAARRARADMRRSDIAAKRAAAARAAEEARRAEAAAAEARQAEMEAETKREAERAAREREAAEAAAREAEREAERKRAEVEAAKTLNEEKRLAAESVAAGIRSAALDIVRALRPDLIQARPDLFSSKK
jgi:hypothetical protein